MGNDESAIPEVIAAGATNRDNERAWYSDHGEELDVVAPGGNELGIATTDPLGENGMGTTDEKYMLANDPNLFFGTSASAPIVTASIALMLEQDANLTREQIESRLQDTSDKIGDYEYIDGHNRYYGYGKLNLDRLLGVEDKAMPLPPSVILFILD